MAEYIEREAANMAFHDKYGALCSQDALFAILVTLKDVPAADVVARDCFDKILAENDDMRAIIDTYGGLENIQSAFVKLHKIEYADVVPVRHGHWIQREDNDGALIIPFVSCSSCHIDWDFETPFCPNCGARMDGDA